MPLNLSQLLTPYYMPDPNKAGANAVSALNNSENNRTERRDFDIATQQKDQQFGAEQQRLKEAQGFHEYESGRDYGATQRAHKEELVKWGLRVHQDDPENFDALVGPVWDVAGISTGDADAGNGPSQAAPGRVAGIGESAQPQNRAPSITGKTTPDVGGERGPTNIPNAPLDSDKDPNHYDRRNGSLEPISNGLQNLIEPANEKPSNRDAAGRLIPPWAIPESTAEPDLNTPKARGEVAELAELEAAQKERDDPRAVANAEDTMRMQRNTSPGLRTADFRTDRDSRNSGPRTAEFNNSRDFRHDPFSTTEFRNDRDDQGPAQNANERVLAPRDSSVRGPVESSRSYISRSGPVNQKQTQEEIEADQQKADAAAFAQAGHESHAGAPKRKIVDRETGHVYGELDSQRMIDRNYARVGAMAAGFVHMADKADQPGLKAALEGAIREGTIRDEKTLRDYMNSPILPMLLSKSRERNTVINSRRAPAGSGSQNRLDWMAGWSAMEKAGTDRGVPQDVTGQQKLDEAQGLLQSGNYAGTMSALYGIAKGRDPKGIVTDKDLSNAATKTLWDKVKDFFYANSPDAPDLNPEEKARLSDLLSRMHANGQRRLEEHKKALRRIVPRMVGGMPGGANGRMVDWFGEDQPPQQGQGSPGHPEANKAADALLQ